MKLECWHFVCCFATKIHNLNKFPSTLENFQGEMELWEFRSKKTHWIHITSFVGPNLEIIANYDVLLKLCMSLNDYSLFGNSFSPQKLNQTFSIARDLGHLPRFEKCDCPRCGETPRSEFHLTGIHYHIYQTKCLKW